MRSDMAQVLIEDARTCSSERSRKWGKRLAYDPDSDYENEPLRTGRRRRQGYDNKQSTDVLGPLEGYLRKNVGRPWNDVYSEICANLDRRSTTGAHVFTHLWQFVERNCWLHFKTGKVYENRKFGYRYKYSEVDDFYVHPITGILCAAKERHRWQYYSRKEKKPVTRVPIEEGKAYEWIKGCWYYTEYSKVSLYKTVNSWRGKLIGQQYEEVVYQKKRQLGKKELRDLGLNNMKLKFMAR